MAPPSAPIRRINNGPTNKAKISLVHIFFVTLIAISIALSGLALHLSRQLTSSHQDGSTSVIASGEGTSAVSNALHGSRDRQNEQSTAGAVESNTNSVAKRNNNNSGKYAQDRVYCMVPFIWNEGVYHAIMQSWGRRCDVINFFTDTIVGSKLTGDKITETDEGYKPYWEYPVGTFPQNVVFINMTRAWNDCTEGEGKEKKVCRHIWEKMWRSWVFVEENHLDQAEWFCKVDYDTFFFPDNVKYYVRDYKKWDPFNEYHYFGQKIQHRNPMREPMIAGATACWSHKTLHDIAEVYRNMPKGFKGGERGKCEDRAKATEEATTSLCLKRHLDVDAEAARDDQLREYVTIEKIKNVLTWNRTEQGEWWYWKGKPEGSGQMEECCAIRPIGLHKYKLPTEILEMEAQFFGELGNKDYNRLDARTKRYVDKVRKAMGTDL